MRIAYLIRWDVSVETGVLKKIREQMRAWIDLGHEVKLFALSASDDIWAGMNAFESMVIGAQGTWSRAMRFPKLIAAIDAWCADLIYLRVTTHSFALESLLKRTPTVLELNSDDMAEYRLLFPKYKYLAHLATRGRILKNARAAVSVTHEIALRNASYVTPVVIANGIDLAALPVLPPVSNTQVRAAFVGSPDLAWHGVDKIVALAEQLPDWQFDLVGPTMEGLPANVVAHGVLHRAEYEGILAASDLAFGTLALHRKGMTEACPLKTREYLAYGLPSIIGYRDTDFPEPVPFLLQLPNTPDNVLNHLQEIREFGERVRGSRVDRTAVAHLDVRCKEERRVELFREVVGE